MQIPYTADADNSPACAPLRGDPASVRPANGEGGDEDATARTLKESIMPIQSALLTGRRPIELHLYRPAASKRDDMRT